MGSPCELQIYAESETRARRLIEGAQSEIARLEARYSRYRDDSIASAINRSAGEVVLVRALQSVTGAYDTGSWGRFPKNHTLPQSEFQRLYERWLLEPSFGRLQGET